MSASTCADVSMSKLWMPAIYADMLLGTFCAARRGDYATPDPAQGRLLAREPRTMREVLTATAT